MRSKRRLELDKREVSREDPSYWGAPVDSNYASSRRVDEEALSNMNEMAKSKPSVFCRLKTNIRGRTTQTVIDL